MTAGWLTGASTPPAAARLPRTPTGPGSTSVTGTHRRKAGYTVAIELDTPDVLRLAADLLKRDGWTQGRLRRADGSRCVRAAIDAVSPQRADAEAAVTAVVEHLDLRTGHTPMFALECWNDQSFITVDDVLAALLETAEAVS